MKRRLSPVVLLAVLASLCGACSAWWPQPEVPAVVCGRLRVDGYSAPVKIHLGQPQEWALSGASRVTLTVWPCPAAASVLARVKSPRR